MFPAFFRLQNGSPFHSQARWLVLAALAVLFAAARFIHLQADFPEALAGSGFLYTDEGWYSNAAANSILIGNWYTEGDFNPAISLPAGQVIQAATFHVFGVGLLSGRITAVVFSILLLLGTFVMVSRHMNRRAASYAVAVLSVNYFLFAYSRMAILDVMMTTTVVMSLLLVSSRPGRADQLMVGIAGVVLAVAVLVKSTALFALPLLMYLAGRRGKNMRETLANATLAAVVVAGIFATYNLWAAHAFPDDFAYFRKINFEERMQFGPRAILEHFFSAVKRAWSVEPVLYWVTVPVTIWLVRIGEHRSNPLVRIALLWFFGCVAMLSLTAYQPLRYMIPLAIPVAVLLATGLLRMEERLAPRRAQLLLLLVALVVGFNGFRIVSYLAQPRYTFVNMAKDVEDRVCSGVSDCRTGRPLLGNLANSVTLVTGIPSINTVGTRDLAWRVEHYAPAFYIALGQEAEVMEVLRRSMEVQPAGEWDVFNNYSGGKKVYLYSLRPLRSSP